LSKLMSDTKNRSSSKSRSRSPKKSDIRNHSKSRSPSKGKKHKSSSKKRRTETEIAEHLKPNGDTKSRSRIAYQRSKNRALSKDYGTAVTHYESYKRESIGPLRNSVHNNAKASLVVQTPSNIVVHNQP
jgi:hypothetical protein